MLLHLLKAACGTKEPSNPAPASPVSDVLRR
jgi:hypothetical protein